VHPGIEALLIDTMTLLDFLGARKLFVFPDAVRHADAPSMFLSRFLGERHLRCSLEHNNVSLKRYYAPSAFFVLRMIFPENRYPLFRIMR
jgi:hypothetical protein